AFLATSSRSGGSIRRFDALAAHTHPERAPMNTTRRIARAASRAADNASSPDLAAITPAMLSALAPLASVLPKLLPFVARAVRRHLAQAIVSLVGLSLL